MKAALAAVTALMLAASPAAPQTNAPAPPNFVEQQADSEMLGSDFIGTPVNTKDGQQAGRIADLVFDRDGRIELAVIGIGGFLGLGEKAVAIPFDALKSGKVDDKQVFVLNATKDQLTAAPAFKAASGQTLNERLRGWRTKANQSWTDIKTRAAKLYGDAKKRLEEESQPKQ
jgi:sporulation protein YlmC with PRC-barrel domain